jgi:hypothetical protein
VGRKRWAQPFDRFYFTDSKNPVFELSPEEPALSLSNGTAELAQDVSPGLEIEHHSPEGTAEKTSGRNQPYIPS